MPWSSLSSRLGSLPLVLAGPIVRKTTSASVSVWIALKEEVSSLQLVIHDGITIINSPITSSKKFGKNLHVALVTINGLTLGPGRKFLYDINFGNSRSLITPGVLSGSPNTSGISKIVYGGELLPSFVLPSNDMTHLKIIHASCRKPHGGVIDLDDIDGFEAIDTILSGTIDQVNDRPQQLYLTGDQIYADDVSDILLFMLRDAENVLLGWNTREQLPSAPNALNLAPLHRLPLIGSVGAGFTCGDAGKSHLLRLGEYYSMYLFVWSQELWPVVWAQDLTPNEPFYPLYVEEYKDYADSDDKSFDGEKFKLRDEYTPGRYNSKIKVLSNFFKTISSARRVLANISTYMIFDDHEITDDWNLTRPWVDTVYGSTDGKRIIQNGLSAYAVFQGWGNKPEDFSTTNPSPSKENLLLDALVTLNEHGETGASQDADWTKIAGIVIPKKPTISETDLTGGIDWSYSLSFDKFNVIVLNARTNRALFESFSGLLSTGAMVSQIRNRVIEKLSHHEFTLIIAPAPVFGLPLMEEFIQPVVSHIEKSVAKADYEPWSADRNKYEQFLKEISAFKRVLFLSGDVHYAFSNSIDYWDLRTIERDGSGKIIAGEEKRSKFVNLTSSSLKNCNNEFPDNTFYLAEAVNNHIQEILLRLETDGLYVGWDIPNSYIITEVKRSINLLPQYTTTPGRLSVNRGSGSAIAH